MQHSIHLYDPVILPRDYLTGEVVQLKDAPIDKNWKSHLRIMPTTCLLGYSSHSRPSSTILSLPQPPPAHLRRSLHPTPISRSEREEEEEEEGEGEKNGMHLSISTTVIGGSNGQQQQNRPSPSSSSIGLSLDNPVVNLSSLAKPSFPEPSPTATHDSPHSSRSEMPISTFYVTNSKTVMDPFPSGQYRTELFQEIRHPHDRPHDHVYSHSLHSSLRLSQNLTLPFNPLTNHTMYSGSTVTRTSSYPHVRTLFSRQSSEWETDEDSWSVLQRLEDVLHTLERNDVVDDDMLMEVVSVSQDFQNVYAGT